MSRNHGFRRADVDVGFLDDPKMRRLARHLHGDEPAIDAAIVTYLATVLRSWATGERVQAEDAAPLWRSDVDIAPLVAVGLLDDEGRVPERAWDNWYRPAVVRMLDATRRATFGGLRRAGLTPQEANAEADRRINGLAAGILPDQPKAQPKAQPLRVASSIQPSSQPARLDEQDEKWGGTGASGAPSAPLRVPQAIGDTLEYVGRPLKEALSFEDGKAEYHP